MPGRGEGPGHVPRPPVAARRAPAAAGPRDQPALGVGSGHATSSSSGPTRDAWDEVGGNPVALLGRLSRKRARRAGRRQRVLRPSSPTVARRPREVPDAATAGPRTASPPPPRGRLLLARSSASPRRCRPTPAVSASSPATTSRPPATWAWTSSASGCSTATATSASSWTPTAGSRSATPTSTRTPCRWCSWSAAGQPLTVSVTIGRARGRRADLARPGRAHPAAAAGHRPRRQPRPTTASSPTGSTAATPSTGCARSSILGIGGMRALDVAREVGVAGLRPAGLPLQRGPRRLPAARAHPPPGRRRAGLRRGRRAPPSCGACSPPTRPVPAGIDRFPHDLMERYFTTLAAECGVTHRGAAGAGPRARRHVAAPARSTWRCWGCGCPRVANGVSQLHGVVSREMFSALWPGVDQPRGPDHRGHQRRARARPGSARRCGRSTTARCAATGPTTPMRGATWSTAISDDMLWRARGRARERMVQRLRTWVGMQRARRGEPRRRSLLGRGDLRPRRADDRLRAPLRGVQARHAAAVAPRPAARGCCCPPTGRCRSSSRARRTRATTSARA